MAPTIPETVNARNDRFVSVPLELFELLPPGAAYSRLMDETRNKR